MPLHMEPPKYVAAAMATKEALWLRKLLSALGVDGGAVPMMEDNQACLALVNNPEATGRTKHVDVAHVALLGAESKISRPRAPRTRAPYGQGGASVPSRGYAPRGRVRRL